MLVSFEFRPGMDIPLKGGAYILLRPEFIDHDKTPVCFQKTYMPPAPFGTVLIACIRRAPEINDIAVLKTAVN
jgi:hypothetical protein